MPDSLKISSSFQLDRALWKSVAVFAMTSIRKRTQSGYGYDGRFPEYSIRYKELKSSGFQPSIGLRKKKPKRTQFRGVALDRQVNPPNFRLTGRTMRDLTILAVSAKGSIIGWRNEQAQIVAAHEERGKYKVGGISDEEHDDIIDIIDVWIQKKWNRGKNVVIKVK